MGPCLALFHTVHSIINFNKQQRPWSSVSEEEELMDVDDESYIVGEQVVNSIEIQHTLL